MGIDPRTEYSIECRQGRIRPLVVTAIRKGIDRSQRRIVKTTIAPILTQQFTGKGPTVDSTGLAHHPRLVETNETCQPFQDLLPAVPFHRRTPSDQRQQFVEGKGFRLSQIRR